MDRSGRLMKRRPWGWRVVALTLVAGTLLLPTLAEFYTDWLWFAETGYRQVFVRTLRTQLVLGGVVAAGTFVWLFANLALALRSLRPQRVVFPTSQGQIAFALDQVRLRPLAALAAGLVAVLLGWYASNHWLTWLLYQHATPFGQADPILQYDIGFYLFHLPLWQAVERVLRVLLLLTLAGVGAIYYTPGRSRSSAD